MVFNTNITNINSSQTLDFGFDVYIIDATSGNLTITLPSIVADGINYTLTRIDTTANTVTVTGTNPTVQTINGATSVNLNRYEPFTVQSLNNRWYTTTGRISSGTSGNTLPIQLRFSDTSNNNNPGDPVRTRTDANPGQIVGYFIYNGTTGDDIMTRILATGSTDSGATAQITVRYGTTNISQSVVFSSASIITPTIVTFSTPTNLPSGQTIIGVYLRRNSGANNLDAGLYSIQIYGS